MIEGTTQTRIDIMNLPEHSKKSCTGKNRKKVLQNFQEKKIYRGGRFIFTRIWGEDEDSLYATKIFRVFQNSTCVRQLLPQNTNLWSRDPKPTRGPKPIEIGLAWTRTEKILENPDQLGPDQIQENFRNLGPNTPGLRKFSNPIRSLIWRSVDPCSGVYLIQVIMKLDFGF